MGKKKTPMKKNQKKNVEKKKKESFLGTEDRDDEDVELDIGNEVEEVGLETIDKEEDDF